jgi:hypothetical protein
LHLQSAIHTGTTTMATPTKQQQQQQQQQIVQDLYQEQSRDSPDPQRCRDLLEALGNSTREVLHTMYPTTTSLPSPRHSPVVAAALLQTLTACRRTFRLLHRQQQQQHSTSSTTTTTVWNDLIPLVSRISTALQTKSSASLAGSIDPTMKLPALPNVRRSHSAAIVASSRSSSNNNNNGSSNNNGIGTTTKTVPTTAVTVQRKHGGAQSSSLSSTLSAEALQSDTQLPETVQQYQSRLQQHGKELYKNPPVLPPTRVMVYPPPTVPALAAPRRKKDGHWTFAPHPLHTASSLIADFMPNVSPAEVLQGGAFGGTYFRPIHSAVTNQSYPAAHVLATTVHPTWIATVPSDRLTSDTYQAKLNKFKVKCGGSLGMWEVKHSCAIGNDCTLSWPPHPTLYV